MGSLQAFSASSQRSLSQAALFPQNKNPSRLAIASTAAAWRETLPFFVEFSVRRLVYLCSSALLLPSIVVLVA
ncbi:hypothetical protein S245_025498 [Arachis hypogaea]